MERPDQQEGGCLASELQLSAGFSDPETLCPPSVVQMYQSAQPQTSRDTRVGCARPWCCCLSLSTAWPFPVCGTNLQRLTNPCTSLPGSRTGNSKTIGFSQRTAAFRSGGMRFHCCWVAVSLLSGPRRNGRHPTSGPSVINSFTPRGITSIECCCAHGRQPRCWVSSSA